MISAAASQANCQVPNTRILNNLLLIHYGDAGKVLGAMSRIVARSVWDSRLVLINDMHPLTSECRRTIHRTITGRHCPMVRVCTTTLLQADMSTVVVVKGMVECTATCQAIMTLSSMDIGSPADTRVPGVVVVQLVPITTLHQARPSTTLAQFAGVATSVAVFHRR